MTVKKNSLKLVVCLSMILGLLLVDFSGNVAFAALKDGAYLVSRSTYYVNPETGDTEDGGSNTALGESMIESVLDSQVLVEQVNGKTYVTLGIGLMSSISSVNIEVQTKRGGSYKKVTTTKTGSCSRGGDTCNHYRFEVVSTDYYISPSLYVTPMGREVQFFIKLNMGSAVAGSGSYAAEMVGVNTSTSTDSETSGKKEESNNSTNGTANGESNGTTGNSSSSGASGKPSNKPSNNTSGKPNKNNGSSNDATTSGSSSQTSDGSTTTQTETVGQTSNAGQTGGAGQATEAGQTSGTGQMSQTNQAGDAGENDLQEDAAGLKENEIAEEELLTEEAESNEEEALSVESRLEEAEGITVHSIQTEETVADCGEQKTEQSIPGWDIVSMIVIVISCIGIGDFIGRKRMEKANETK